MTISALDPKTALVVIDIQKGIVGLPTVHPMAGVVANCVALAKAFRAANQPVVLVNVSGAPSGRADNKRTMNPPPGWDELVPELDRQPDDIIITKYTPGAFHGTGLDMQLRRRGVTQIVLCGVSTSSGVESTARAAYEHGYNVAVAIDAVTDMVRELHDNSIERIFPKLAETGTTADVLARVS
jgi:nicotinamidase-related amidase